MNTCLDQLRKRKSHLNISLDVLLEGGWSPVDGHESPDQHVLRREARAMLEKAIYSLQTDMRSAFILRDIYGYSYDEISGILNVNIGTIKSRISRARQHLREKISAHPELFDRMDV